MGVSFPKDDKYNPRDCKGKVVSLNGKMNPIIVEWENGMRNSYQPKELQTVYQSKSVL